MLNPGISCFENTVDPEQLASNEASCSGSTLFPTLPENTRLQLVKEEECSQSTYNIQQDEGQGKVLTSHASGTLMISCADPESFVRGGPNLITFLFYFKLMRAERIQIPL